MFDSPQCGGCVKNTQCFGEWLYLQPPLLLHRSHFPEKHLPGLPGFTQLPGRRWEQQEVRGGPRNPLCIAPKLPVICPWDDMAGGCNISVMGKQKPLICWLCKPYNSQLYFLYKPLSPLHATLKYVFSVNAAEPTIIGIRRRWCWYTMCFACNSMTNSANIF